MKKYLLFLSMVFEFGRIFSQNLDIAWHGLTDKPKQLISINSKCYYIDESLVSIRGLNNNGQALFTTALPGFDWNALQRFIRTKDNCLAVIGTGLSCDVTNSPTNRNFFVKTDTNGVVKFQTIIQPYLEQFIDLMQHADSSYYMVSDSLLYHYSKNGVFISKINTGMKGIKSAILLISGNLLISGRLNNIIKNVELTTSAVIVNQQSTTNLITKFVQTPTGKIFGLTLQNTVEKFAANFSSTNSSSATVNSNINVEDFTMQNDTVFMAGSNTISNTPSYIVTDQNFSILYQAPLSTYKNIVPTGIAISKNNKMNIIARGTSAIPVYLSYTSYYQFPFNGNFTSKYDIGVISYSITSQSPPNYGGSIVTFSCNLDVTVKNFTNDTIKNFYLNYEGFQFFCQYISLHKFYDTIILPNSAVNVKTGNFNVEISANRPDLCVYTTIPNSSNDVQVDNDGYCKPMSVILDLIEKTVLDKTLKIFPNPFTNLLKIETDSEISKIEIYNASGKLIAATVVKYKQFSFDSSGLPSGIYLLKIETEKGFQIKKVIKD